MTISELLEQMTLDEKISLLAGESVWGMRDVKRLGIPAIRVMDGPHGLRSTPPLQGGTEGPSTNVPSACCMAAGLRLDLVEEIGKLLGKETKAKNFDILLAPCINLHRVPIGGRNFESFSEDPFLTAEMGRAYIDGVQSEGVGTSLKHFAVNNQEYERMTISVEIDERTLREIYLYAFEEVIKRTSPWTVMGSYNKINGTYACENEFLLKKILRDDWGYDGVVVSDWTAVHSSAPTIKAGCNIEMPGPGKYLTQDLRTDLEKGLIAESDIDFLVKGTLELIEKCIQPKTPGVDNTPEHQTLCRQVAEEGIVLLKNDNNVLPIEKDRVKKLAILGPLADAEVLGGGGSSLVTPPYHITALQGIKELVGDDIEILFDPGCSLMGAGKAADSSMFSTTENGQTQPGLYVEYFNNANCENQPVVTTHVPELKDHYYFADKAPIDGINDDNYSILWRATMTPKASGNYYFSLTNDDKAKLVIDGNTIINNWDYPEINIPKHGQIQLKAGQSYSFELYYGKINGFGGVRFTVSAPQCEASLEKALQFAEDADAVIIFAGLNDLYEAEGADRESMHLPEKQDDLIEAVAGVNPNTVVALYNGSPIDMRRWCDKVAGIVECWYPGQENGRAVANILFGKTSPSGKLPTTFPVKFEDSSCYSSYPGKDGKISFDDKLFMGYRHHEKNGIKPQFPFGHGLSYTEFEYSDLQLSRQGDANVTVSLKVKNTGQRDGAEGVQVYVSDLDCSVERPLKELKGFSKIFLNAGEEKEVTIELNEKAFSFYSVEKGEWTWEAGEFSILVGSSSQDIRIEKTVAL